MSEPVPGPATPIHSVDELVAHLAAGAKPRDAWKVGTEHEKFGVREEDGLPIPYDGERGVERVLAGLAARYDWERVEERGRVIALRRGGATVTIEPGGQLELSGVAFPSVHATCPEITEHLREVKEVSAGLGVRWLGVGFHPLATREQMPWMPKRRYEIMRAWMPRVGTRGLDMMVRTCTVQANFDHGGEADAVRKMRTAMGVTSIITAMFASSPLVEGRDSGFQTYRAWCWRDTDNARSGLLRNVFQGSFGFAAYVEWALDVPMYLVRRGDQLIDMTGTPFRAYLEGRAPGADGLTPTIADWEIHLTTLFPEVRLKTYIEVRGADAGAHGMNCALPALWKGILYDDQALDDAWSLVSGWTFDERVTLADAVCKLGLRAPLPGGRGTTLDHARALLAVSRAGLQRQASRNSSGEDEARWLRPLEERIARGVSASDDLLARWNGEMQQDPRRLVDALAY
jgi:glutamate--cysteine ligase